MSAFIGHVAAVAAALRKYATTQQWTPHSVHVRTLTRFYGLSLPIPFAKVDEVAHATVNLLTSRGWKLGYDPKVQVFDIDHAEEY